jgi:surface protein
MNSYYRKFIEKQKLTNSFTIVVKTNNEGVSNNNQFQFTGSLGNFRVIATPLNNNQSPIGPKIGFGNLSNDATITFPNSGLFELEIIPIGNDSTRFRRINFNNGGDRLKLLEIKKWGNVNWTSFTNAFFGCSNLNVTATDIPNLTNVFSLNSMFRGCSSLVYNNTINTWTTSSITNMATMFNGCTSFNQPLNSWDVSNVTGFNGMFQDCTSFNQPLNNWILNTNPMVSINMNSIFRGSGFNQNINTWNVSRVTNMVSMFRETPFNEPLNNWDVSSVTNFSGMFQDNIVFNQPLNNWVLNTNTSVNVTLNNMFNGCIDFNQNINTDGTYWNTSRVTNMTAMFTRCLNFNQPLNNWNTSRVDNMSNMFQGITVGQEVPFNQNINTWDVSNVTNFSGMFAFSDFNQPLDNWVFATTGTINMNQMFRSARFFNQNINTSTNGIYWNTSRVTNMAQMLQGANSFGQPLNNWDVSNVTTMFNMFRAAISFDQDISSWNIRGLLPSGLTEFMALKRNSNYSTTNYDALLISWASYINGSPPLATPMTLGMGTSSTTTTGILHTTASNDAKEALIDYGWIIIDGHGTNTLAS